MFCFFLCTHTNTLWTFQLTINLFVAAVSAFPLEEKKMGRKKKKKG